MVSCTQVVNKTPIGRGKKKIRWAPPHEPGRALQQGAIQRSEERASKSPCTSSCFRRYKAHSDSLALKKKAGGPLKCRQQFLHVAIPRAEGGGTKSLKQELPQPSEVAAW